jgi:hypothetical protein
MAKGGPRSRYRQPQRLGEDRTRRRRRVVKPASWPKYVIEKQLRAGRTAYYWNPPNRDIAGGFTLGREKLGPDYGIAVERATILNAHLDASRQGRCAKPVE